MRQVKYNDLCLLLMLNDSWKRIALHSYHDTGFYRSGTSHKHKNMFLLMAAFKLNQLQQWSF